MNKASSAGFLQADLQSRGQKIDGVEENTTFIGIRNNEQRESYIVNRMSLYLLFVITLS